MIDSALGNVQSCNGCSYLRKEFATKCDRYHVPLQESNGNLKPEGSETGRPTTHFPYCYNETQGPKT